MSEGEILILEDDAFILMDIEMTLAEAGYKKLSAHSDADAALAKIRESVLAAALLDFNLGKGETSLAVAEELKNQSVPFVFLTGYTDATVSLPDGLSEVRRISKPFRSTELVNVVKDMTLRG
ncbi:response regulator [Maribius pontilimi]|uniref:Response regulator n=1 Tax=Palleronia pontilimi TaxID=1964209 RepID=A0A934MIS2_9RHOB|nr:response regulator [Palleronia pontilimi]MBJ3764524.1 response regulator [Palleronia pontilimi]